MRSALSSAFAVQIVVDFAWFRLALFDNRSDADGFARHVVQTGRHSVARVRDERTGEVLLVVSDRPRPVVPV